MKRSLPLAALATALLLPATASAQDALVEGPGVKVGEATVLHPRVGAEAGIISNVFFEEAGETLSPVLRILAGLDIASQGEDRLSAGPEAAPTLTFRGGVELQYQEYLSSNEAVRDQRNLDAIALADAHFFPKSNASFKLQNRFQRASRPTNFESDANLTRDINHFIGTFGFHPHGRTLSAHARYENFIDFFESDESQFANRMQHLIGARVNWKFFPYSQTYLDASYGFYGGLGDNQVGSTDYKVSSNPLTIRAGIDTLLAETVTVKAHAGYANGFYESGPSYNTYIAGLNLGWRYNPLGRLVVGYAREAKDSINANFYTEHHIFANVSQAIQERFILNAGAGVHFRSYQGINPVIMGTSDTRDDFILEGNLRGNYMLQDRYSLYAEYLLQSVQTDFRTMFGEIVDDPSYVRHAFFVGAMAAF